MALWALTASHHQPPMRSSKTIAAPKTGTRPERLLNPRERAELRKALQRTAGCATRKILYDPESRLYVPGQKSSCGRDQP